MAPHVEGLGRGRERGVAGHEQREQPKEAGGQRHEAKRLRRAGHTTKYIAANVRMSKTELIGPSHSMKETIEPASHLRGRSRRASSTLSHGSAAHETV